MSRNPLALSWGYTDRAVELCYLRFHLINEHCFEAAPITLPLPVRADKVWVHNPTLVLSVLDNEAAAALTTTHRGLKVVMMNPPPLTVRRWAGGDHYRCAVGFSANYPVNTKRITDQGGLRADDDSYQASLNSGGPAGKAGHANERVDFVRRSRGYPAGKFESSQA